MSTVTIDNPTVVSFITGEVRVSYGDSPASFKEELQKLTPDNRITLFELDATAIGGGIYRFTSTAYVDGFVKFRGKEYTPIAVDASGFEVSGKGTLPTPTFRIANSTNILSSALITYNDLLGATLYRIRTFKRFLDDGAEPNPSATFPIDVYRIDRKVNQNKVYVELELSSAIDQEGRKIPGRQIIRDYCSHIYRVWNEETESFDYSKTTCPYVGSASFDEKDNPVNQISDRCGKRLSSCKKRFGDNAVLPTRAFPGVKKI